MSSDIWLIANHHLSILRRKFERPFHYEMHEFGPLLLRLDIWKNRELILVVSFLSSSIKSADNQRAGEHHNASAEEINYADPRFTDSILPDILEKVGT